MRYLGWRTLCWENWRYMLHTEWSNLSFAFECNKTFQYWSNSFFISWRIRNFCPISAHPTSILRWVHCVFGPGARIVSWWRNESINIEEWSYEEDKECLYEMLTLTDLATLPRRRFCKGAGGDLPNWRISICQHETLTSTNLDSNSIWKFCQKVSGDDLI